MCLGLNGKVQVWSIIDHEAYLYDNIASVSFLTGRVISVCSVSNVLNCIHMHSKRGRYATSRTFLYPPGQAVGGFLLFGVAWEAIYYGRQVGILGFDDQKSSCRAKVLRNLDWLAFFTLPNHRPV